MSWRDTDQGKRSIELLDRTIHTINKGREGKSVYIPFPFLRLGRYIDILPKSIYLVGGTSGSGKTAFVHQTFVLWPYMWYMKNKDKTDIKLKIVLRSMERPPDRVISKWICYYLYTKYKILLQERTILRPKSKLPDEIYDYINEARDYFEEMLGTVVEYIPAPLNPTGIRSHMLKIAEENGKVVRLGEFNKKYIPNDDNLIVLLILDHMGKLKTEKSDGVYLNDKAKIDKMCDYCAHEFRDFYGFSSVMVSQFNRSLNDPRRRQKNFTFEPEESDFMGSSNMFQDSDLALAVWDPYRFSQKSYAGYNIPGMVEPKTGISRFRGIKILKSSYGRDRVDSGAQFIGEIGKYSELPFSGNMTPELYSKYSNIEGKRFDG